MTWPKLFIEMLMKSSHLRLKGLLAGIYFRIPLPALAIDSRLCSYLNRGILHPVCRKHLLIWTVQKRANTGQTGLPIKTKKKRLKEEWASIIINPLHGTDGSVSRTHTLNSGCGAVTVNHRRS